MSSYKKLKKQDLILNYRNIPNFKTTLEVPIYNSIIGQQRAVDSINLGLKINRKDYNIFISGKTGTGKTGYIVRKIEEYAQKMCAPEDWCYVYNFKEPNAPIYLSLKTGTADSFKESMSDFIKLLLKEVPVYFNSENYSNEKNRIIEAFNKKMLDITKDLSKKAEEKGLSFRQLPTGEFLFVPMANGKEMDASQYDALSEEQKNLIEDYMSELRIYSYEMIKDMRQLEKQLDEDLKHLDENIAENIITPKLEALKNKFDFNEKVIQYIELLKKDLIQNITAFLEEEEEAPPANKEMKTLFFRRYFVNVLVSNNPEKGAPVVFADTAQYGDIFGDIEYENKLGNLITDFTLIRSGYLHKANGGFLIIKAHQLFTNPAAWEELKKCINLETIFIETSKYNVDLVPISTLKPENIPLKTKVILIGNEFIYSVLSDRDLEFHKLFKIKAEFDNEIEAHGKNIEDFIGFLSYYTKNNDLFPLNREAVEELLRYSSRLSENKNYFSASMNKLLKIADIADYFAKEHKLSYIDKNCILKALEEDEEMHSLARKKTLNFYKSGKYIIDLTGSKVGQINGLSIMDYGDSVIGKQHRITVSTYAGKKGIVNIERKANMSGKIHNKGVLVLSGFLGEFIGQEIPISFNANIVFEQLYSGIDGDSASAAELIALISSLSDIPINQSLAITGSVNQKGEIQPIGGVNDKIEGYFDICSLFGLDGSHGVIIPESNLQDLVLKNKVIEAVDKELFQIYTVKTIEDCLKLFCDLDEPSLVNIMSTVKVRIMEKLINYNKILKGK